MSSSSELPSIGWCVGKDCRKADRNGSLRAIADRRGHLVDLKCLDLCDGAVVVGPLNERAGDDAVLVFRKVRKPRVLRDILDHLIDGAELTSAAAGRRVEGSKRARAVRRIEPKR